MSNQLNHRTDEYVFAKSELKGGSMSITARIFDEATKEMGIPVYMLPSYKMIVERALDALIESLPEDTAAALARGDETLDSIAGCEACERWFPYALLRRDPEGVGLCVECAGPGETQLHVFRADDGDNNFDYVVAGGQEDAAVVWKAAGGESEPGCEPAWELVDDDEEITITGQPTNTIEDGELQTMRAREWIVEEGRGVLCFGGA